MELQQLLARMKEEHARSAAAIEALDRQAADSSRRLDTQRETIARMGEEVTQIQSKTLQSAGAARQISEVRPACSRLPPVVRTTLAVTPSPLSDAHAIPRMRSQALEAERAETAALDAEAARLEADFVAATSELDILQQASSGASTETLDDLTSMRGAWRKRCRTGQANIVALACSLSILELEAEPPFGSTPSKRACAGALRTGHEPSGLEQPTGRAPVLGVAAC